jgi:PilZ domain-containing protein
MESFMTNLKPERRRAIRRRHDHGIVLARVRAGHDVTVIDVSSGGTLVESRHRMLPGAMVELHLETTERRTSIRGRVLRCAVSRLRSSSVCYRGAIGFDRYLPWFADDEPAGYAVPTSDRRPGAPARAEPTQTIV